MQHRGKVVSGVLDRLGYKRIAVAERMQIARSTMYNYLQEEALSWKVIRDIGRALEYDFRKDFPDMPDEYALEHYHVASEAGVKYGEKPETTIYELKKQLAIMTSKYMSLLEKYNEKLEKDKK